MFPTKRWKWISALWGVLPDIGMIGPLWYLISKDGLRQLNWIIPFTDRTDIPYLTYTVPDAWFASYHILHSFIPFLIVGVIISIIIKRVYIPIIGWGLHVFLDLFLHDGRYATQFLYPVSTFSVDAPIGWQNPWIFGINWLLLAILFLAGFIYLRNRKRRSR